MAGSIVTAGFAGGGSIGLAVTLGFVLGEELVVEPTQCFQCTAVMQRVSYQSPATIRCEGYLQRVVFDEVCS